MIQWFNPCIIDHPIAGRDWGTNIQIGQLNQNTFILRDLGNHSGMSLTNNMENALDHLFRSQSVMEHEEQKLIVYHLETDGLYRLEHEWTQAGTRDIKWIYAGPNTKCLEVLYGG